LADGWDSRFVSVEVLACFVNVAEDIVSTFTVAVGVVAITVRLFLIRSETVRKQDVEMVLR
jgi:hypothetical protein